MTGTEIMVTELIKVAMISVYFLILYFKINKTENKVNEIKRKIEEE